ncbi:Nucleoporin Nup43 [Entophlyctis luteolus]|nr:Nucleoporin Nup43 [Entophlyctis luteolus]
MPVPAAACSFLAAPAVATRLSRVRVCHTQHLHGNGDGDPDNDRLVFVCARAASLLRVSAARKQPKPDAPWLISGTDTVVANLSASVTDIALHASLLLAACADGSLSAVNLSTFTQQTVVSPLLPSRRPLVAIAASSARNGVAIANDDGTVALVEPAAGFKLISAVTDVDSAAITGLQWRGLNEVVFSTDAGRVGMLDFRTGSPSGAFHDLRNVSVPLNCIAVHPEQNATIATGNADGKFPLCFSPLCYVLFAFPRFVSLFLMGFKIHFPKGTVKVWDLRNSKEPIVRSFQIHSADVWDIVFPLSDAFRLTTCSQDGTIANFGWSTGGEGFGGNKALDRDKVRRYAGALGLGGVNSVDAHGELGVFVAVGDAGQIVVWEP